MPGACRLGDKSKVPLDVHGCPACPHPNAIGPAVAASGNVFVNGMPALRVGDPGIHAACCNTNTWKVVQGSGQVFINGAALVRKGDKTRHCGGLGQMVEASGNVEDGSAAEPLLNAEAMRELQESVDEWLERVQENGIAELLDMISPPGAGWFFAQGESDKLTDPDCQGAEYLHHLAKCLPSKPPGSDEPRGPRPPYDPPVQPVGFFDLDNPITDAALLGAGLPAKGLELGGEGLWSGGRWAGGKLIDGAGDVLGAVFG